MPGSLLVVMLCAVTLGCTTAAPARANKTSAATFAGHSYRVFENKISWQDAQKHCAALGGYLCCIETGAEADFIAKLANGRYLYLGGTDETQEDDWRWVNGSPWKFSRWMDGQPNNYGDTEDYLATYDGGEWVDVDREGDGFWMPTGCICEWDSGPVR